MEEINMQHNHHYSLIIECCRHEPESAKLETLSAQITDWSGCLNSAYAHGIYPLVAKSLKSISSVPEHIKSVLKITNLDIARRNMMMTSEMLRIMKLLEENGIQALAIKGPVLSQIIHGDVTSRQYADIDILIHQSDLWRAGEVLSENSYVFDHGLKFLKNKTLLKIAKDVTFSNPLNNIHTEVHWRLFSGKLFAKSNLKLFHETPTMCRINQREIATLDHSINLLYLLLHGSKHMWERIEWIVDIDRLIRSKEDIDWDLIYRSAQVMEIEPMVFLGLAISRELFGTPIPVQMAEKIDTKIMDVTLRLKAEIENDVIIDGHERFLHDLADVGLEKKGKIKSLSTKFFRLSTNEVFMVDLPLFLSPLYYVFKVYHAVRNYIFGITSTKDH